MRGTVVAGRYRVESRLGAGGMSTVYLAEDTILERQVALKVLAEHLSEDERLVARFRREALAVAKLVHPNIVQVYDTGVDGDRRYIVMEYVDGRSAAQLLRAQGVLAVDMAVEIGGQACEGLHYAHKRGIVHRDVKPGNMMIVDSGDGRIVAKLTDFGIALAGEQTRITQVGSVVGTAAYLAPEQAHGEGATPVSDIYSLGVVLYQFLTGRPPFEGSSLTELAIRQQSERPLSPTEYNDEVPEELGWAVLRALEIDPAERYAGARDLSAALRDGLAGEGSPPSAELPTRMMTGAPTAETARMAPRTQVGIPEEPVPEQPRRRSAAGRAFRALAVLLALAALAGGTAAAVILASGDDRGARVRQVVEQTVRDQAEGLRELVEDNTR